MKRNSDLKSFINTIDKLKGSIIIVEGKRDEKALRDLGLKHIVKLSGKSLIGIVEEIAEQSKGRDVVILTDFDREGRSLASRINRLLQRYRITPKAGLRKEIMEYGKTHTENLRFERIGFKKSSNRAKEDDYHGKVSTNFNKIRNKGKYKGKRRYRET